LSSAVLLANGKVFLVGGRSNAQLYDAASGVFSATGAYLGRSPVLFTATLLADGRVLSTGADISPDSGLAELYDPADDMFSPTGAFGLYISGADGLTFDAIYTESLPPTAKSCLWVLIQTLRFRPTQYTTPRPEHSLG
jgi:hypothetical protein